jgi:hypothetical protein
MRADDVRRWVGARQAAEQRERLSASATPEPAVAWRQALSLFALVGRMVGWPIEPDPLRRREDAAAAEAWRRLRAAHRRQS